MASYQCDFCGEEVANVSLSDMTDGTVKFIGPACMPLLGLTLVQAIPAEELDGALKTLGYQPSKALRDARKEVAEPEFDAGRTIAEVVESAPRIDTGEAIEPQGDSATDPQSDLSTNPHPDEIDGEVVVGETMDGRPITQPAASEDEPAPPY